MVDRKTSDLNPLAGSGINKTADLLKIVDVSEASPADKDKRTSLMDLLVGSFCGALVKKAGDQTTANYSAGVMMTWDAETYDTDAWHDTVTNNTRLTVPAGLGITKVIVTCNVAIALYTGTSAMTLLLNKNGSNAFDGAVGTDPWPAGSATTTFLTFASGPIPVVDGDYFEVQFTNADTSITVTANRTNFSIQAVG